jgi:prevent-host-death family protein
MKTVQASDAKVHLLDLLDEVEEGHEILITRRGTPIATLSPLVEARRRRAQEAFARMDEIRKKTKPVSVEEILAWRHEGHRY